MAVSEVQLESKTKYIYMKSQGIQIATNNREHVKTHLLMVIRNKEDCQSSARRRDHAALLLHDSSFTRK